MSKNRKNDMLVCIVESVARLRDGHTRPVITAVAKAPWFIRLWRRTLKPVAHADWEPSERCVIESSATALHAMTSVGFHHDRRDASRAGCAEVIACLDDDAMRTAAGTEVTL